MPMRSTRSIRRGVVLRAPVAMSLARGARLRASVAKLRAPVAMSLARGAVARPLARVVVLLALVASPLALVATSLGAEDQGSGVVSLTLIPTQLERTEELRIHTGEKAMLADGSYNTVYDFRKPGAGNIFIGVSMDVSVENGAMVFDGPSLRLHGQVDGQTREYHPIDWYRDEGLVETRGDTLRVSGAASIQVTFEVPRAEVEQLTFSVGGLHVGSVPAILSRVSRQE